MKKNCFSFRGGTLEKSRHLRLRLTLLCLLLASFQLHATASAQKIDLNLKNVTLKEVFDQIRLQTGYSFMYSNDDVREVRCKKLQVEDKGVNEIVERCLKGTGLTYEIADKVIIIKKLTETRQTQQKVVIEGIVRNAEGESIPGVTVVLKGTSLGGATDIDGQFILEVPQMKDIVLIFSFVGMKTKEVVYAGEKCLEVVLENTIAEIEEVVVNGYFNKNKESLTGNVITVSKTELEKVASQNILSALQVFDPSYKISENITKGSDPNSLPEMRIRGNSGFGKEGVIDQSNLRGDPNLPTFILDGYEVDVEKVYDLDLTRVESVTILKDASATAIYGSRAANGVIVITQKAPEPGKLRISYNFTATLTTPDLSDYNLLNAGEKLELERKAGLYDVIPGDVLTSQMRERDYHNRYACVLKGVDTYWLSQPLETAFGHKHSVYLEGGDRSIRYAIDLMLQQNPGVMKESERNRYGAGFMLSYNLNDILLFRNYISIDKIRSGESPYGSFSEYAKANPYYPIYDEEGKMCKTYASLSPLTYRIYNPLYNSTLNNQDKSHITEITDNFDFDWYIDEALRLKARLAYSEITRHDYRFDDPNSTRFDGSSFQTGEGLFKKGQARDFNERSSKLETNVVLTYNQKFGKHFLNAALGGNIIEKRYRNSAFEVAGFANSSLDNVAFANQYLNKTAEGDEGLTRLAGLFVNANYTFNNVYLVDVSWRLDGASQFGNDKRFAPFWSAGIGWNIHQAKFFKCRWMDRLKLTANVGQLGKASFSPYQAQTLFEYNRDKWYSNGLGATVVGIGNEHLQWEKTRTYDVNLEVQVLKGVLSLYATYYVKNTENLLADISLPLSNGFETYKDNLGELSNKGIEITLRSFIYRDKDWTISVFASGAHNRNKIKKISSSLQAYNESIDKEQTEDGNKAARPLVQFREGQSTTAIYAVRSLGINPGNGNEVYVDRDGGMTYDWNVKDKVVCGDTEPKLSGSLGANIDYKGFNLNFNFLYDLGGQLYNQTLVDRVENADVRWNVDARVLNERWQKPGDRTFFKRIDDNTKTEVSSRFVEDNNMFRLQNLSLSYTFNKKRIQALGMSRLKIGFLMNDVFRASSVKMERGLDYPFARSYNLNLQVQF